MARDALPAALREVLPVLAAPMAGGPGTPAMVVAAAGAGSLGFLAGGYRSGEELAAEMAAVRHETGRFGVNLFAPNPVPVDPAAYRRYAAAVQAEADAYGLDLAASVPVEDDDRFAEKIDVLAAGPPPVVSFTFGIPDAGTLDRLRRAGCILVQTVTSPAEARAASEAGMDVLVVQGPGAGGHSGTLTPDRPPGPVPLTELVAAVGRSVGQPLLATGGIGTPDDVAATRAAGAGAVLVGTALLLTEESGASPTYRAALAASPELETVVTRAFTGRPARGLRNRFIDRFDAVAPLGYPALHHLTSPLRRAAARAGDPGLLNLWAGTGHRHTRPGRTADVLTALAGGC